MVEADVRQAEQSSDVMDRTRRAAVYAVGGMAAVAERLGRPIANAQELFADKWGSNRQIQSAARFTKIINALGAVHQMTGEAAGPAEPGEDWARVLAGASGSTLVALPALATLAAALPAELSWLALPLLAGYESSATGDPKEVIKQMGSAALLAGALRGLAYLPKQLSVPAAGVLFGGSSALGGGGLEDVAAATMLGMAFEGMSAPNAKRNHVFKRLHARLQTAEGVKTFSARLKSAGLTDAQVEQMVNNVARKVSPDTFAREMERLARSLENADARMESRLAGNRAHITDLRQRAKAGDPSARAELQRLGGFGEAADGAAAPVTAPVPGNALQLKAPGSVTSVIDEARSAEMGQPPVRTVEFPVKNLVVMDRIKQFKRGADPDTGVVRGQGLQGSYERLNTGPILVWERVDGKREVITGRNRFDLAKRTGEETIPAQVVREVDGFTQQMAERFDAEANIRDGQGEISDYAHYVRNYPELTPEAATDKGLLARAKGQAGWALGRDATDDLYALFQAGRISERKAVAIAQTAPRNAALQAAGIEFSGEQGVQPEDLQNYLQTLMAQAQVRAASGVQGDLFGFDDAALNEARELARAASRKQNEIRRRLGVMRAGQKVSSAKFQEIAREYGINVADPDALMQATLAAEDELEAWQRWATDPEKVAALRTGGKAPAKQTPSGAMQAEAVAGEADAIAAAPVGPQSVPRDAMDALEELDVESGQVRYSVREPARSESPFRRSLRLVAEGEAAGPTGGNVKALASRELVRKAKALLAAMDAGRIDEAETMRRWRLAQSTVKRGMSRIENRPAPRAETGDMFAPAGPAPGMLLSAKGQKFTEKELAQRAAAVLEEQYEASERQAREHFEAFESGEPPTYGGKQVIHPPKSPGVRADAERHAVLRERRDRGEAAVREHIDQLVSDSTSTDEERASWARVSYSFSLAESPEFEDLLNEADRVGVDLVPVHSDFFDEAQIGNRIYISDPESAYTALQHGLFHVADEGGSPAAQRLVRRVNRESDAFKNFHRALSALYRTYGVRDPTRNVAAKEIAARLFAADGDLTIDLMQGDDAYAAIGEAFTDAATASMDVVGILDDMDAGLVARQQELRFSVREQPGYLDRPVPTDDPQHTMFPMELPEAVDFMRKMAGGLTYPKVRQKLRALRGTALGFYHGGPPGSVQLKADIWNLIHPADLVRLNAEAQAYVDANVPVDDAEGDAANRAQIKKAYLKDAIRKLRDQRLKENPRLAGDVAWHEIGHWIDDLPDWAVNKRGNILGHVAALRGYTKDMLAALPDSAAELMTAKERAQIRRAAEKQVGPRPRKERLIERKVWSESVKAAYQELLDTAADERGLVRKKTILAELEPVIAWWYGTETIPPYYTKPEEMYAAAFSVLANNPAALKARAPTYWALWHDYQLRRPAARARFEEYQHAAAAGRIQGDRDRRQADALRAADVAAEKAMRAKFTLGPAESAEALGMFLFRGSLPVTLRAGRADAEVKSRTLKALQDQLYHEGWASAYMLRAGNEVGRSVFEKAGVPALEWSLFLQNMHISENRQDIASMLGMNPAASKASLAEQRARLGNNAFDAMQAAGAKWAELRQRYVIDLARKSGIWSEELWKIANQRVWYSTVAGVDLDKDPLEAAMRGIHGGEVGPRVYRQTGYLGAARDPWVATLELDRSLVAAAYRNKLKLAVHELLSDIQEPLFREGEMRFDRNTNRQVPETGAAERAETVVYLVDGKPHSFWAPRSVAEFIDSADPFSTVVFQRFLQMAARDIKGVYTYWNYGFPLFNTPRDIMDWVIKLPGWKTRATYHKYEARAKPIADSIVRGEPSEDAVRMLERNIMMLWPQGLTPGNSTTLQTVGNLIPGRIGQVLQQTGPQTALERLARAYQMPGGWLGADLSGRQKIIDAAREWYTRPTARGELTRKVAGWLFLEDRFPEMSIQEKQRQVQMMAGSPNFPDKPQGNWFADTFITFWNAAMRGTESTWKAVEWDVKNNRPYQADFWKTMLLTFRYGMLPKLILAGLAAGWFKKAFQGVLGDEVGGWLSDEYQKMERSIPQYYKDNYAVYPVWWDPTDRKGGKKVIFVTNPLSEHTRFGAGIMWKLVQGKDVSDLLNFGADNLPGYNPVGTVALAWIAAARGHKPGWVPMSQTQFDSGHWKGPMMKYTANNLLGGMVGRFPRETISEEFKSPLQKFLQAPVIGNTLGRRVRVSDKGWDDWYRNAATPITELEAQVRNDAYNDVRREAKTGRIPKEAIARYSRGAAILAGRPDDQIAGLPREQYVDAYYAQRFRAYKRQLEIERLPADQRIMIKAKNSVRSAMQ